MSLRYDPRYPWCAPTENSPQGWRPNGSGEVYALTTNVLTGFISQQSGWEGQMTLYKYRTITVRITLSTMTAILIADGKAYTLTPYTSDSYGNQQWIYTADNPNQNDYALVLGRNAAGGTTFIGGGGGSSDALTYEQAEALGNKFLSFGGADPQSIAEMYGRSWGIQADDGSPRENLAAIKRALVDDEADEGDDETPIVPPEAGPLPATDDVVQDALPAFEPYNVSRWQIQPPSGVEMLEFQIPSFEIMGKASPMGGELITADLSWYIGSPPQAAANIVLIALTGWRLGWWILDEMQRK